MTDCSSSVTIVSCDLIAVHCLLRIKCPGALSVQLNIGGMEDNAFGETAVSFESEIPTRCDSAISPSSSSW